MCYCAQFEFLVEEMKNTCSFVLIIPVMDGFNMPLPVTYIRFSRSSMLLRLRATYVFPCQQPKSQTPSMSFVEDYSR